MVVTKWSLKVSRWWWVDWNEFTGSWQIWVHYEKSLKLTFRWDGYESFSGNKPEKHMTSTCSSFHFNDFCICQEESVNSLQSTLHHLIFNDHNHTVDGRVLSHENKFNKTNYWWEFVTIQKPTSTFEICLLIYLFTWKNDRSIETALRWHNKCISNLMHNFPSNRGEKDFSVNAQNKHATLTLLISTQLPSCHFHGRLIGQNHHK